jgi:chemotaxis protein histidine kinase CheA
MERLKANQRRELRALRQAFGRQLPDRVRAIEKALDDTETAAGIDRESADVVFQLAHRLCGSAAIYGYRRVHDAACALECAAEALRDGDGASRPTQTLRVHRFLETLKRAAGLAPSAEPAMHEVRETVTS